MTSNSPQQRPAMTMREIRDALGHVRSERQLDEINRAVAASFDEHEPTETRQARWEAAALAAGREVDRNALAVYMAVADAEHRAIADRWATSAASTSSSPSAPTTRTSGATACATDSEYPGDENFAGQLCALPEGHFGDHRREESIAGTAYTVKLRWPTAAPAVVAQPGKEG